MKLSLALLCALAAFAQDPETFEVASIKLADPLANGTSYQYEPGASLKVDGATLKSLILFAYDLRDFQLTGATGWMNSDRYTIRAKGVTANPAEYKNMNDAQRKASSALIHQRMKALLAERFQLIVHTEKKELPIYALVLAKGGSKLTPNNSPDGSPQSMMSNRASLKATRASLASIAQTLASITQRPVHDETALQGYYDLKLEWTPDAAPVGPESVERPPDVASGPSLLTALQEQLGLKLEGRKGPVEILVIDRAEHPSEN